MMEFPDGVVYQGDFYKGILYGKGKYTWPDGSVYNGEVAGALRQGFGVFRNNLKGIEYKGNWYQGKRDGKGEIGYKSGAVYKGEFKDGKRHGFGVIYYRSGNFYQGQFKNGQKWGYGEMYWEDSKEVFRGFWRENKQNGYGEHVWLEKFNKHKNLRNRYEGMFLDGMRHGIGCFYYSDGTRYEGEWVENKKEGFAFFTNSYGEKIEGIFKSDRIDERLNTPRKYKVISFVGSIGEGLLKTLNSSKSSSSQKGRRSMMRSSKNSFKPKSNVGEAKEGEAQSLDQGSSKNNASLKSGQNFSKLKASLSKSRETEKQAKFRKRNEVNQITNPYVKLLNIDDLLENIKGKVEKEKTKSSIEVVMMRYNALLMQLFQKFKHDPQNTTERSFSLKMRIFWKFLRGARVLTPSLTLSQFNKIFYSKESNVFKLRFQFEDLRDNVKLLKLKRFSALLEKVRTHKFKSDPRSREEEINKLGQTLGIGLKKIHEAQENDEMSRTKTGLQRTDKSKNLSGLNNESVDIKVNDLSAVSDRDEESMGDNEELYNTNYLLTLDPEQREFEMVKKNDASFRNCVIDLTLPKLDYRAYKDYYKHDVEPFLTPGPTRETRYRKSPFCRSKTEMNEFVKHIHSKDLMLDSFNKNTKKLKMLDKFVKGYEKKIDEAYEEARNNAKKSSKNQAVDEVIQIDSPISDFPKPLEPLKFDVFDVHDGENIMLFRNFIDAILRIIYIREDFDLQNFKTKIEKYIEFRIRPLIIEGNSPDEIFGQQAPKKLKQDVVEEGESFVDRVFFGGPQGKKAPKKKETKVLETGESRNNFDTRSRASNVESYTDGLSNTWNSARYSEMGKLDSDRDKSGDSESLMRDKPKRKKRRGYGKQIIGSCKKILKHVFNQNLKNRFISPGIEDYYGKIGESTREMVMDFRNLLELMERAGFVKDNEDKDLLVQIVERHFDPDSSFTAVMDRCLKQQPFLFTNTQGSFGLSSYYRENLEDYIDHSSLATSEGWKKNSSKTGNSHDYQKIKVKMNNKISGIDVTNLAVGSPGGSNDYSFKADGFHGFYNKKVGKNNQTERDSIDKITPHEFDFEDGQQMNSYDGTTFSNARAILKATENMRDLIGDETASVDSKEMDRRLDVFDWELATALNKTLGAEILFFEFVEIFIIYCYSKVKFIPNFP